MRQDAFVGDTRYYDDLAARARDQYNPDYAQGYRESDDRGLEAPTHTDQGDLLTEVSQSFQRPIDVLDLACGTGRYWHHLRNVRTLTGVDISPDMLRLAKHPVREKALTFPRTLVCASLAKVEFEEPFDLVYAIGVFGGFLPFDSYIVSRLARLVKPGGQLVVTTGDRQSPQPTSWKRLGAESVLPVLPRGLQRWVRTRLRNFALTEADLRGLMRDWRDVQITRRLMSLGRSEWVCRATKAATR